jgi:ADP-ribose pyrophosphatase
VVSLNNNNRNQGIIDEDFSFNTLYNQCNSHLLESDKKRDQILILLASITGLYIGNLDKLRKMPGFAVLAICIVVMGIIFAFVVLEYRKWHVKYALACVVIQRLMFIKNNDIDQKKITEILRSIVVTATPIDLFKRTESWIFNLYVAINFINIYILEASYNVNIKIIYLSIIIYFIVMNYIYYKAIRKLCDKEEIRSSNIWIINLFGKERDIKR